MKVYVLLSKNEYGSNIVKILSNKELANDFKEILDRIYTSLMDLNEQEDNARQKYWESHQFIMDKNRILDKYHEEQSYKDFIRLRDECLNLLASINASLGKEAVIEEYEVNK